MSQRSQENDSGAAAEAWRLELRRGLARLREGDFGAAEHHFFRAHRLAPNRPEAAYALGRERLRAGRAEEAEPLLRAAWEGDRSLLSAGAALARCLGLHLGRFDEAAAVLAGAEAHHGEHTAIDVVSAELDIERGQLERARASAERALRRCREGGDRESASEAARAALARVENQEGIDRAERGDVEAALFCFKRAADLDPEWSSPHVNLGAAFAGLGRPERARAAYRHALALEPDNAAALANFGRLCLEHDELDRALDLLREAAVLAPHEPGPWVDLAAVWQRLGAPENTEDCLRQAVELEPCHVEACCRLADLLARDGRYLEAARLAERAQLADPERARLYLTGRSGVCSQGRPGTER